MMAASLDDVPVRKRAKVNGAQRSIERVWKLPNGLEGHALCALDLIAEAQRPPAFVIDRLAEGGDVILLKGAEKLTFKTWLAVDLAIARIVGGAWLGFDVVKARPERVLIISTETRGTVLVRRTLASCGQRHDAAVIAKYLHIIDKPITLVGRGEREQVRERARGQKVLEAQRHFDADLRKKLSAQADDVGDWAVRTLGSNVELLDAIAQPNTWSLIIIDTLRQCLRGDENSSEDGRRFIAAARELARECGCPVVVIHHTGKGGDPSDARSSRGTTEFTAGPDVLISLDPSGEYPTAHFQCRNVESPAPVGYKLVRDGDDGADVRVDVLPACAGKGKGTTEDDVFAIFEAHPKEGLTLTFVRKVLAAKRGKAKGSKESAKAVQKHVRMLEARGAISACKIVRKHGEPFDGYRLGRDGGEVPAVKLDSDASGDPFADATDV